MRCARELVVAALLVLPAVRLTSAQDTTASQADTVKADTIYLKDGRVLTGRIVDSMPSQGAVVIRLRNGQDIVVTRSQMARMVRVIPPATPTPSRAPQRVTVVDRHGHEISSEVVTPATVQHPIGTKKSPALAWFLSFL